SLRAQQPGQRVQPAHHLVAGDRPFLTRHESSSWANVREKAAGPAPPPVTRTRQLATIRSPGWLPTRVSAESVRNVVCPPCDTSVSAPGLPDRSLRFARPVSESLPPDPFIRLKSPMPPTSVSLPAEP